MKTLSKLVISIFLYISFIYDVIGILSFCADSMPKNGGGGEYGGLVSYLEKAVEARHGEDIAYGVVDFLDDNLASLGCTLLA